MEHSTLTVYVQQLQNHLRWDPDQGEEGQEKQVFAEALTELAALPLDSISMEIRLLHLHNVIAALSARDVLLKCKAANAVGSLFISRVAGQQLLDLYGDEILKSVAKMATRKNQWVQGDAFYVLGWMVVIADKAMLIPIADLLPTVIKCLHRNLKLPLEMQYEAVDDKNTSDVAARRSKVALASSEQASNFRVYALVLLLNFSQRHINVFENQLGRLLPILRDLVVKLLESVPTASESTTTPMMPFFDASEFAEVLRLAVALLAILADELGSVPLQLLELKTLPSIIKLKRVLDSPQVRELIGETNSQDIADRLEAVVEILLKCR
ncbi:unnamed protein product [Peronospora destructor]|uniref:RNA polymerase II assembly factor Rtp1 C-terminal domain-containing protein n=1 Tax=Peronospora destructor TaxID=86335 RepID=A0AAV0TY99_9STRA|nr:unnamed protein product [Peronospora destructor]